MVSSFFNAFHYSGTFLPNKLHLIIGSSSTLHNPSAGHIPAIAADCSCCCICRRFRSLGRCCSHIISYLRNWQRPLPPPHTGLLRRVVKSDCCWSGQAGCYVVRQRLVFLFVSSLPSRVVVTRAWALPATSLCTTTADLTSCCKNKFWNIFRFSSTFTL